MVEPAQELQEKVALSCRILATVRALNFNTLARVTLQVAQTGRRAPDISPEDIENLPDLGSNFNDTWVCRYYVRKLLENPFVL